MNDIWDRDYTDGQQFKVDQETNGRYITIFMNILDANY